jgi:hypothetical protein
MQISISCLARDGRFLELFALVLLAGFSFGFIETFHYPAVRAFYRSADEAALLGTDLMLGRICISISAITIYWNSGLIIEACGGRVQVLRGAMLNVAVMYLLYGQVDAVVGWANDYADATGGTVTGRTRACFFLAEAVRGGTFALFMSTAVGYAHAISPPPLRATVLQLLEATYRGVGFMSGGILGGRLVAASPSTAHAFRLAGRVAFSLVVTAFLSATTPMLVGTKTTMDAREKRKDKVL